MGGAFLSQPVTSKRVSKYQHGKIRVITCEMQGNRPPIQAGGSIWRTPFSSTGSVKISFCLQSSMGTAGSRFLNFVLKNCRKSWRGMKTSKRGIIVRL